MNNLLQKLKSKISRRTSLVLLPIIAAIKYHNDKNYDLALVDKGFASRMKSADAEEHKIVERIIRAYNKAKAAQKNLSEIFQVSNEWLPIYNRYMGNIIDALTKENAAKVSEIYGNFMRDDCSTGLQGLPLDMKKCFFSGKISRMHKMLFLADVLHRHDLWKKFLGGKYTDDALSSSDIGNPYGYYIDGKFIRTGAETFHYFAARISGLLKDVRGRKMVAEIGGGYGGMAYFLLRDNADVTYADFDLPENMALTSYYLLNSFPKKKALLYGEGKLDARSLAENEIIIMPNFEFAELPSGAADLVYNSYSLAEMSRGTIDHYVSETARISKRYFLHVNHTRHSAVVADDFGVDRNSFDLASKQPARWSDMISLYTEYYEYLYKKKDIP